MYNNHSVEEGVYSALDSALLSGSNPAQTFLTCLMQVGVKNSTGSVLVLGESAKIFSLWEWSEVHLYFILQHTHNMRFILPPPSMFLYLSNLHGNMGPHYTR